MIEDLTERVSRCTQNCFYCHRDCLCYIFMPPSNQSESALTKCSDCNKLLMLCQ